MQEPIWILDEAVEAIHKRQLAEHGGAVGIRDAGLLASALGRPKNLYAYESEVATLPRLAAACSFGIARNHPFIDGNKRTAFVVSLLFLRLNGLTILATPQDRYETFMALAEGRLEETELAAWFEDRSRPVTTG